MDRRPRAAPGDKAKIEEAVRRLRSAEELELHLGPCSFGWPRVWAAGELLSCKRD